MMACSRIVMQARGWATVAGASCSGCAPADALSFPAIPRWRGHRAADRNGGRILAPRPAVAAGNIFLTLSEH